MGRVSERADARANRERLVAAAREVFAERGIDADVKEICERSGIGVATFYRNFATKDDLVAAIIEEVLGEVSEIVDEAERQSGAEAAIDAMIIGALAFVERHQELARALRASGAKHIGDDRFSVVTQRLEEMVVRGQDDGVVRRDIEPRFLTDYIAASNMLYLEILESWPPTQAREWMRQLFWSAIRAPGLD